MADLSMYSDEELKQAAAVGSPSASEALQFAGTTGRSATNNNPLNLEHRPGSYQDKYGAEMEPVSRSGNQRFAKFPTMEAGYNAGLDQIRLDASRGHTLSSFVAKFAPPHENPTAEITAQYARELGVSPDTPIAQIPPEKLIVPMLKRESSTKIIGGSPSDKPELSKYTDAELKQIAAGEPTQAQLDEAYGLPPSPAKPAPIGVGTRILGNLGIGVSESTGRAIGLGQTMGAAEALGPAHGFTPEPASPAENLLARREAEAALMPEVGKRVAEQPAESFLGQLGEGLVRTIPELPLFYGAGEAVNVGLRGASLLPRIGGTVAKVADYLAPEAVRNASLLGALPRVAAHGALTGAALGGATAVPGERLEQAGEEALGFAVAAPAFHLAGKAIFGLAKGIGKSFLKLPENFHTLEAAEKKFDVQQFETRAMAKESAEPGDLVRRVEGKWAVLKAKEGVDAPVVEASSSEVAGPTFGSVWEANAARERAAFPSGVEADVVAHKDGSATLVPDYQKLNSKQYTQVKEIGEAVTPGDIARMGVPEIPAETAAPVSLVEEVRAAQGGKREAVPLRSNLNEAAPAIETPTKPLTAVERAKAKAAAAGQKEEVSVTISPNTGEVKKVEVVKRSKSPERDRVHAEIDASYPRAAEAPQEVAVIKALHDASAKRFERLGQGTKEDYYKGQSFKLGEQLEGYNEAFYQKDGKFVTEFMPSANISTAFHAAWHYIENTLPKDYISELSKWRGKDYSTWETADFEHAARAFERFWAEGRVGFKEMKAIGITPKVAKIFADLKGWMLDLYVGLKGKGDITGTDIDVSLNRDLENVFRKALGLKELEAKAELSPAKRLDLLDKKSEALLEAHDAAVEKFGAESAEVRKITEELSAVNKEFSDLWDATHPKKKVEAPVAEPPRFYDSEGKLLQVNDSTVADAWDAASNLEAKLGADSPITKEAIQKYIDMQTELNRLEGAPDKKVLFQKATKLTPATPEDLRRSRLPLNDPSKVIRWAAPKKADVPRNAQGIQQRGFNSPKDWNVFTADIHPKDITPDIPLTEQAIVWWKQNKSELGHTNLRGLSAEDVISILSAAKRGEASVSVNRQGDFATYKIKQLTPEKKVLFQESAHSAYQKAGHLEAFTRDADTLQNHTIEKASVDQKKVLFQAAAARSAKTEARIAEAQAKKLKLEKETANALTREVSRAHESNAKMMELARVWDFGPEEVTTVIKKGVLTDIAKELGMTEQVAAAEKTGKLMELYRSMFDVVRDRVDAAMSPDLGAGKDISGGIAAMSKISDLVNTWHKAFVEHAPFMLRETPAERTLKNVGAWIEDRLGYSPKVFDKYTKAAYEAAVNMQHYSRNMPVLKPIFAMGQRMTSTIKELEKGLLEGDTDASVRGWMEVGGKRVPREVRLPGIMSYTDLRGNRPDLAKITDAILWRHDQNPLLPRLTPASVEIQPEVIKLPEADRLLIGKVIGDVRESLDYTYFKLRSQYEDSLAGLSPASVTARMRAWDRVHEYHQNYMPHVREGSVVLQAKDPVTGETLYSTRTSGGRNIARIKRELEEKYGKGNVGDFTAGTQSKGGVSGMWLTQFATNIMNKAEKEGTAKEAKPFVDMINRMVKEFGLRGHYIAREKAEGIPGFEEDIGKALISYGKMFASHMGKTEFVQGASGEIASLKGYGRVQDYARRWVELALKPSNQLDSAIAVAKNAAFMKYIGGVLKTAVVTTFDKITNAYPMMGMYVKNPGRLLIGGYKDGATFMKWEHAVGKHVEGLRAEATTAGVPFNTVEAVKAARAAVELPKGIKEWERDGILQLRKTGQLDAVFTDIILEGHRSKMDLMSQKMDMTGTAESYLKHGWNKSLEWSGKLIGTTESYGRMTTALSAMRMFKQLGFSEADAIAAGGRFMLDAHGYYGKINLPLWMQEKGLSQVAKLPFTFRVFEHHYINLMAGLLSGQQGKAGRVAAAKSLGLVAGLGGMMSLPFFTTVGKLFRKATGTDPEQYVRKQLNNIDNSQTLADMFSYGVPASGLGVSMPAISLRSSTELGRIDPSELILGAPGQVVSDVAKGASGAMSGDWNQFFDAAMPTVLKNPKRAYERYYYGALGASGKKLTEGVGGEQIKYTAGEALGQAFGFTPSKMEKYYQQSEVAIADKEYWLDKRKALYRRLQRAFNMGDEAKMEAVFQDIASYNDKAISLGPDVTLITPQEIRQSLKDRIERKKFLQAERLGLQ